ncbi:anti-phage ZorAB system protein ZorA [Candidatus Albibeggiatoa sp. nov. NOAA]|uniref:anti-phage ZorAB system protein ZorA n=1 Tax=Candidatus Albibeggiatoa sp. nov. NOAA TaxID=3162724 RepID=UPI0032FADF74|nr:anti-phage ZorAB system protein ZorA [Thiotrichaceae bacterium]
MDLFFSLINHGFVPWLLALGIVGLGIGVWVSLRLRIAEFLQQLNAIQTKLDAIPPDEFVDHYEEFNEYISQYPLFSHQWATFRQTLILPNSDDEYAIYYTNRPNIYFNQTTLVSPQLNLNLYQAVPNILVGIGLFFTFIGLIAALWFASEGVAAENVEEAKAALSELLHAATFKFITSVAGLMASIVFSWREKAHLHQLSEKLHALCLSLEQRLYFTTLEQLTKRQVDESKRQTEQLSRFNSELAVSIAHALEDEFTEKLLEAIQPLAGTIEALESKLTNMNQDALQSMVEQFSQSLQGAAGQEMQQMATTLQSLEGILGSLGDQLNHSSSEFTQQMQDASSVLQQGFSEGASELVQQLSQSIQCIQAETSQEMQKATEPMQQLLVSMQEMKANIDESSLSLQRQLTNAAEHTADTLSSASEEFGKQMQQTTQSLGQIREQIVHVVHDTMPAIDKMLQQLNQVREGLKTTESGLRTATPALIKATNHVEDLTDVVMSSSNALMESGNTVEKVWKKYQKHFEGVDNDVGKMFQELSVGLDNYRDQVENFTTQLDESLNQSVKSLSGMIVELVEAIEELTSQKK